MCGGLTAFKAQRTLGSASGLFPWRDHHFSLLRSDEESLLQSSVGPRAVDGWFAPPTMTERLGVYSPRTLPQAFLIVCHCEGAQRPKQSQQTVILSGEAAKNLANRDASLRSQ
ncbi:MAG: hypothetical protein Kow00123_17700 [Anaerolineales bacterium]